MSDASTTYDLPDFDEASSSQIPAILQLINLGYTYIPRGRVETQREGRNQYILRDIAKLALRAINPDRVSDKGIEEAVLSLEKSKLDDGVAKASELIYSDLICGRSVTEIVQGKNTSPQMKFVDWENPANNTFHVVAEFEITEEQNRRPDIVLFVNGIPFAVIENKKSSVPVDEAVRQMIRNQQGGQVPKFFLFPQVLVAANMQSFKYATMLTPFEFYFVWREKDAPKGHEAEVLESVNKPVAGDLVKEVAADLSRYQYAQDTAKASPSIQDAGVYGLLRPARLLEIVRNYIVYDNGVKKIARYQQYFAIKKTLVRIQKRDEEGRRLGGVVWHTQGSGKSLTMVMLVKNLIETIENPRVIVVTDRKDLDVQIRDTFKVCNIKTGVQQATSSKDLLEKVKSKTLDVITTLVFKFERETKYRDEDSSIFLLIDEAHRSQGGDANVMMNRMLPNACQIAFTGTPLMKRVPTKDKGHTLTKSATLSKYGGLIDAYKISEAEADNAILPLIYQGRFVEQTVSPMADKFYERIAENLSKSQLRDFEKKCISSAVLEETSQRIEMIAYDVVEHYTQNFKGTGLKAQLVAPSKYAAIMFKAALDLAGDIKSEVIISDSQITDAEEDKLPEHKQVVKDYLDEVKRRYGTLEKREKLIIQDFKKNPEGCELLIVVDKLLTGFDAPRDTVLYLAKQLKDHNLLQAIARVNRVFDGDVGKQAKTSGLIVDYSKNAKNLRSAMELFSNYDVEDIERALLDTDSQLAMLEDIYQKLHDTFATLKNKGSQDAYVQFLKDDGAEERREVFFKEVNHFIRAFSMCLSLYDFQKKFGVEKVLRYKMDLKKFLEIKKSTQLALAMVVDFSKYNDQIRKILDKYVTAEDVEILSKEIKLSDVREFNNYLYDQAHGLSDKSKAEAIGAQTKKIIEERYSQDEAFYEKFSERIRNLLSQLKLAKREDLRALLDEMVDVQHKVADYEDNDIPEALRGDKALHPFYRNIGKWLHEQGVDEAQTEAIIAHIVAIIRERKIVDFEHNTNVKRDVVDSIEDYLLDDVDAGLKPDGVEKIAESAWSIAVNNKGVL